MIKMKKTLAILFICSLVLQTGVSIAYYNTKSLLYDEAKIISFNSESFNIYDYNIDYKEVINIVDNIKDNLYSEYITI